MNDAERWLRRAVARSGRLQLILKLEKILMDKAVVLEMSGEIYHASCFAKEYPNKEKAPTFAEVEPESDYECERCNGLLIDPPQEDDPNDSPDDDEKSEEEEE